jgi:hypothetical protein
VRDPNWYKLDPDDVVPFRIMAERRLSKLKENGCPEATNMVGDLLQKLYHSCSSSRIEMNNAWFNHMCDMEESWKELDNG